MTAAPSPLPLRSRSQRATSVVWQPGQPAFWVFFACLLACAPLQLIALAEQRAQPAILGIALLMAVTQGAIFWLLGRRLLRGFRGGVGGGDGLAVGRRAETGGPGGSGGASRSASLRLAALAWGLAVVPVIGAYANGRHFNNLSSLGLHSFAASIAAPIDEDTLRFVGVLGALILASRARITVLDGLILGFLVGAGFEIAENLACVLDAEDLTDGVQVALIRSSLGFGLHALWTGIAGAALAGCLARAQAGISRRWRLLLPGFLIPMLLHALWDAPGLSVDPRATVAVLISVYAASLVLFAWVAFRARPSQKRAGSAAGIKLN